MAGMDCGAFLGLTREVRCISTASSSSTRLRRCQRGAISKEEPARVLGRSS